MVYAHKIILTCEENRWVQKEKQQFTSVEHEDIWAAAGAQLVAWAAQLPHSYEHVGVYAEVLFRDGRWFRAVYPLMHRAFEAPSLAKHLDDLVSLWSGAGRPVFKPRGLHAWTLGLTEERMDLYAEFARTHTFGSGSDQRGAFDTTPDALPLAGRAARVQSNVDLTRRR